MTTVGGGLRVVRSRVRGDAAARAAAAAAELVTVHTTDGEEFPVHRRLLRPCISLTRAIREAGAGGGTAAVSSGKREAWERQHLLEQRDNQALRVPPRAAGTGAVTAMAGSAATSTPDGKARVPATSSRAEASVGVDCATFDRVLLWLEAETLGRPLPDHDIRTTEDLEAAANVLGLRSLGDSCRARLGAHKSRIRRYAWSEIVEHNARGGVWIVVDGMVLDVKRWLPEHPGEAVRVERNVDPLSRNEKKEKKTQQFCFQVFAYVRIKLLKVTRDTSPRRRPHHPRAVPQRRSRPPLRALPQQQGVFLVPEALLHRRGAPHRQGNPRGGARSSRSSRVHRLFAAAEGVHGLQAAGRGRR